jgi:hypothetical protein
VKRFDSATRLARVRYIPNEHFKKSKPPLD